MPTGPITIQFSNVLTYIIFTAVILGSVGILVKKGWDIWFDKNKKINQAVTKGEMEAYVEKYVVQALKLTSEEFERRCTDRRAKCDAIITITQNLKDISKALKEDVRDLHTKIDERFDDLNGAIRSILAGVPK